MQAAQAAYQLVPLSIYALISSYTSTIHRLWLPDLSSSKNADEHAN